VENWAERKLNSSPRKKVDTSKLLLTLISPICEPLKCVTKIEEELTSFSNARVLGRDDKTTLDYYHKTIEGLFVSAPTKHQNFLRHQSR
jgi:hypothetical protein